MSIPCLLLPVPPHIPHLLSPSSLLHLPLLPLLTARPSPSTLRSHIAPSSLLSSSSSPSPCFSPSLLDSSTPSSLSSPVSSILRTSSSTSLGARMRRRKRMPTKRNTTATRQWTRKSKLD